MGIVITANSIRRCRCWLSASMTQTRWVIRPRSPTKSVILTSTTVSTWFNISLTIFLLQLIFRIFHRWHILLSEILWTMLDIRRARPRLSCSIRQLMSSPRRSSSLTPRISWASTSSGTFIYLKSLSTSATESSATCAWRPVTKMTSRCARIHAPGFAISVWESASARGVWGRI